MDKCVDITSQGIVEVDTQGTKIIVLPPKTEEVIVEPSITEQVITPSQKFTYINKVTAKPVTKDIDDNIQPYNIKKGVRILNVDGNLEPDKPDQTKTVTPTKEIQRVVGDTGFELAECIVNPIPQNYIDISDPNNIYNGEIGEAR